MADSGASPFDLLVAERENSLSLVSVELSENSDRFSLERLLEVWGELTAIRDFLLLIESNRLPTSEFQSEGEEISLIQVRDFALLYLPVLREKVRYSQALQILMGSPNAEAQEIKRLLSDTPPEELAELIIWLNDLVRKISALLSRSAELLESYLGHLEYNQLMAGGTLPVSPNEPTSTPSSNNSPSEPSTPISDSRSAQAVVPTLPIPEPDSAPAFPTQPPSPTAYQILSLHNGFARNDVAHKLLQIYGIPAEDGNAWNTLSPQLQYLISRDLQAYLFSLEDDQLLALNRDQFVERFFQDFRQRHPFILQPEFALRHPTGVEKPAVTEASLAQTSPVTPLPVHEEADQALEQVKALTQDHFFSQDLAELQNYFLEQLKQQGHASPEPELMVHNLQNLLHYIPALGEDPNLVLYGATKEELVKRFPFLSGKSDQQINEILHQAELYAWRYSGLLAKTLNRPSIAIPQTELPTPETSEKLANAEVLTVGIAKDEESLNHLLTVSEAAATATPLDDQYQGVNAALAMHTSAAENQPNHQAFQNINHRVIQPVYKRNASDVAAANGKRAKLQVSIYEQVLLSLQQNEFESMRSRLAIYYQQHQVLMSAEAALQAFNDRMASTRFGKYAYSRVTGLAAITPNELISQMHEAGVSQRFFSQPRSIRERLSPYNLLRDYQRYRRAQRAATTIQQAQTLLNKSQMMAQILLKAKKAADTIKTVMNLAQIIAGIKAFVAGLLASLGPVGALILGGLGAIGLGSFLVSALGTGAANAAPAAQALGQQAGHSLTEGFKSGSAQAKPGTGGLSDTLKPGQSGTQGNVLGRVTEGVKDFISSASPSASSIVGVGGMSALAVVGISTVNSSFYKPLNPQGEESPYIDIVKVAEYDGATFNQVSEITGDMQVTYHITITPKENYTLDIKSITDVQRVDFNEEELEKDGRTAPEIAEETRTFPPEPAQLGPGESIEIEYQETFTAEYMDSTVFNEVTVVFDATDAEGNTFPDESAALDHRICFGVCPVLGEKCWPTTGEITQNPFDSPEIEDGPGSHKDGLDRDAFDIGAPATTAIYAPFNGRLCRRQYMDSGYGNWVVLDQVSGGSGSVNQLVFAHMSSTYFDDRSDIQCEPVSRGEKIGEVGNSGGSGSTGNHLHYGAAPPGGTSVVRQLVPDGNDLTKVFIGAQVGVTDSCGIGGS